MGRNIALNIERNGFPIAVYNRTYSKTEDFINGWPRAKTPRAPNRAGVCALLESPGGF
jgi:6-phosphogluconate dehydrogenase